MTDYDITFEKDQLDRADPAPAACRHGYIPVADELCPDCYPLEAMYFRLIAGGTTPADAAAIVDAGFMSDVQMAGQGYEKVAA